MIVVGRNIAVVESGLLKRELVTTIVTPLMHRQARICSTLITNSRKVLRLLLTILFGELLWRGMGILRLLLTMLLTAARLGSPRRGCEWNFGRISWCTILLSGTGHRVVWLGNPRNVNW